MAISWKIFASNKDERSNAYITEARALEQSVQAEIFGR
ncbi:hypothetical protein AQZ59_01461 [Trueperella bernardiae]|uniref:Uncharacterized protein n=1 Tax=Trueperella bernardiae TaxID=59561 RepID=A0A0W1KJC0_9ACTO|nr:hypothetical protein AQZ59_01461 [Trueperella bernardiae]